MKTISTIFRVHCTKLGIFKVLGWLKQRYIAHLWSMSGIALSQRSINTFSIAEEVSSQGLCQSARGPWSDHFYPLTGPLCNMELARNLVRVEELQSGKGWCSTPQPTHFEEGHIRLKAHISLLENLPLKQLWDKRGFGTRVS